jgi:hypothetical protein
MDLKFRLPDLPRVVRTVGGESWFTIDSMEISQELFAQQRRPRFGNANPERMQIAFWEWMIRGDETREEEEAHADVANLNPITSDVEIRSGYGPYHARKLLTTPLNCDGPIWTFDRMGSTRSELPDGRILCIGGEHEDYYDPDFYIYNDAIVFGRADEIEIYGYPPEVFPPTDFHTATLVNDRIIVIGCLGYQHARRPGYTPVYGLDVSRFHITEIQTRGENPGWIFKHEADFDPKGVINIRGGEVIQKRGDTQQYRRNLEDYALDVRSWTWHRATNRNWSQFSICQENKNMFVVEKRPEPQALLPRTIKHIVAPCDEWNGARIVIDGVPVSLRVGVSSIDVVIEGNMAPEIAQRFVEDVRTNAETIVGTHCFVE